MASADFPLSEEFKWSEEYESILKGIASTDLVEVEWTKLRDIIKYKINQNVESFLSESEEYQKANPLPEEYPPESLPSGGLKLPPFPLRTVVQPGVTEAPKTFMSPTEANEYKDFIFAQLHDFDQNPPFTIQRVCELCLHPKQHYRAVGKYLRAVEKSLFVTTTYDAFPPLSGHDSTGPLTMAVSIGGDLSSTPATPLFSPIPFLHDDARRSKSHSPPPSPLVLAPADMAGNGQKALGLVDELDNPGPGHMSEHPIPLTATTEIPPTSRPFLGSLEQRFVKSENMEARPDDSMDAADDKG